MQEEAKVLLFKHKYNSFNYPNMGIIWKYGQLQKAKR